MSVLASSIDTLHLPTRMQTVASRLGLVTVGDLARCHPAALLLERSLGQRTLAEVRAELERVLGMRWEDAAEVGLEEDEDDFQTSVRIDPSTLGWDGLVAVLPESIRSRPIGHCPIPQRLVSFANSRGISTLDALVRVPAADLRNAPNLGQTTIRQATEALLRLRDGVTSVSSVRASDWRRLMVEGLAKLPMRERMVLTQRAGLVGPPPTLQALGESLGVSRERVRQLEASAVERLRREAAWTAPLAEAILALAPPFVARLAEVADVGAPLVGTASLDADAFALLLDSVFEGAAGHTFEHGGTAYFGLATRATFESKLAALERACETLVYPIGRSGLRTRLAALTGLSESELDILFDFVRARFREESGRVVGYGARREDAVMAFLRAEGRPVSVGRVMEKCGRGPMPDEVVWLERGLVTLPELVPDFASWAGRLGPLVAMLMSEHGESRQWSTTELFPLVGSVADLPEWMNPHSLGSVLRSTEGIAYLGRNVVALSASHVTERSHMSDVVEEELAKAGEALPEDELLRLVRARRAMSDATWSMQRTRAPFLLFGNGKVGLFPRDVDGGVALAAELGTEVFEWLGARDRGAVTAELAAFLADLGAPYSLLDKRLVRTLLRHDGRFRFAQGGGIGLAVWGETRTPSQRQVLEDLLEPTGRISVQDAIRALPTASGEPMSRMRLGLLANAIGAKLAGDHLVKVDVPSPSLQAVAERDREWIERVPEKAAWVFAQCLGAPRSAVELRAALVGWRTEMASACSESPAVDRAQVVRLVKRAESMLAEADSDSEWGRAARAAVEYLVRVDDGESDMVPGGLDDDEAVMAGVVAARSPGALAG